MSQSQAKSILDFMTPEDLARVKKRQLEKERQEAERINKEWFLLAELGYYYGWQSIRDYLDDFITSDQATMLLKGARIMYSNEVIDRSIANIASRSTKVSIYNKLMKPYYDTVREIK